METDTQMKEGSTMPKAQAKARIPRGTQSHGGAKGHVGGIAGCISMKARENAVGYVGAINLQEAREATVAQADFRFKETSGTTRSGKGYMAVCFQHGVQKPCKSRKAAIHTCRTAGSRNPKATAAVAQAWCKRCVTAQQSTD